MDLYKNEGKNLYILVDVQYVRIEESSKGGYNNIRYWIISWYKHHETVYRNSKYFVFVLLPIVARCFLYNLYYTYTLYNICIHKYIN